MTLIMRVDVAWTGFIGGPGVNTLYFTGSAPPMAKIHDFYASLVAMLPDDVTITFPTEGPVIDDDSGDLDETLWASGAESPVVGTDSGSYAAPVGAVIRWNTGAVVRGRRLQGRSFIVPMAGLAFETNGVLTNAGQSTLITAADAFLDTPDPLMRVWSRPPDGESGGSSSQVTSATVTKRAAVLRSRRD